MAAKPPTHTHTHTHTPRAAPPEPITVGRLLLALAEIPQESLVLIGEEPMMGIAALRRRWRKQQSRNFRSGRKTGGKAKARTVFRVPQGGQAFSRGWNMQTGEEQLLLTLV